MGELADLIFNADGSQKDGTPYHRPDTTPAEMELTPMQRAVLATTPQQDPAGWWGRQWDRVAFKNAKPGDSIAQTMWKEAGEAGSSFMSGLRRSRFNYAQAAQNSAVWVADKFGLEVDAKRDFLAASLNKWKNMRINPTTDEWEDQLFYLIGNLAPDAVGLVLGGGIVGGAVSMGAKAAGWSKSASSVATILGRITGDTAINTAQFMAHEAAQAEIEGREAEYAQAGKEALAMGLLMSTTARASKAFGLSRKSSAVLTGSVLAGTTSLYYDDNDPGKGDAVAANAVLGGLFGLAVPQTSRVGAKDIQSWVRLKRQAGQEPSMESFFQEFLPESYDKLWKSDPKREDKLYTGHWSDPEYMSPKDDFLMFLSQVSGKNVFGRNDNQLVHLIADIADEHGLGQHKLQNPKPDEFSMITEGGGRQKPFEIVTGINRSESLQHGKILMDAMNQTDAVWMKDHPDYKPLVEQPHTPPKYDAKEGLKRTADNSKEREAGIIAHDKDGKPLQAHELSWNEFKALEGDTPIKKEFHLNEVQRAATAYNPKQRTKTSWPNKGALIEHELWDQYGWIHARPEKGFTKQPAAKTGEMIVEATKKRIESNREEASARVKQVLQEAGGPMDKVYQWLVDPAGRLFNELEKRNMLPVRNALQLQSLKKGKVQSKIEELDNQIDFLRMSLEEDAILSSYIFLSAEKDYVKRGGHQYQPKERELVQRPEQINDALRILREDAEKIPGGWDKMKGKVKAIEDLFADMLENLTEAGIVGKKTYDILKDYKWTPQKTIREAVGKYQDFLLKRGKRPGNLNQTDNALHDLMVDADLKGKHTNIQALTHEWIAYVHSAIAKNELFNEMSKIDSEWWHFGEKPKRVGGEEMDFVNHTFMQDGVETPVWIEKKISTLLEAKQDRMLGGDLQTSLRMLSGVHPIQMTAVATNPFFAIFTHPLDLWSIATHHQALPKFVPTIVKDMYVHNAETGAFPMIQNFMHAWKKDDRWKRYVHDEDGTISTIVSSVSAEEMMRRSTNIMDQGKMTERFKRGWNNTIQALGKFGHTMEVAMRMTEQDMLIKTGKYTPKEASHESLRRLNYNRRGEFMHVVDSLVPFANAQAQILASQMSEIKTAKGALRVASTVGQLSLGLALTRVLIEEHFPEYYKDIPWENRMRYWIIPTGAKEIDHKSGQEVQHYFKIKKAYNPFFMLANAATELALDRFYYGEKGMPPISAVESFYEAIKVATPVELQNNIPPIAKVLLAYTGNVDFSGRKIYRGPEVEARDEINTEIMGGTPTHNAAILAGQAVGVSPARTQAAFGSFIARNPLAWFAGSFVATPPEASQSAMTQIVKSAGIRGVIGSTNKKWAEYEQGSVGIKEAGSSVYSEYYSKVLRPIAQFYNRDIGSKAFINQVKSLVKDSKPSVKIKMIDMARREIKAKALMDQLLKKHPHDEVYDYMQPYAFWLNLQRVNAPEYRAKMFKDRMDEIDDSFWLKQFKRMAAYRGLFRDRFFAAEFRKLQRQD